MLNKFESNLVLTNLKFKFKQCLNKTVLCNGAACSECVCTRADPIECLQDEPLVLVAARGGLQNVKEDLLQKHLLLVCWLFLLWLLSTEEREVERRKCEKGRREPSYKKDG